MNWNLHCIKHNDEYKAKMYHLTGLGWYPNKSKARISSSSILTLSCLIARHYYLTTITKSKHKTNTHITHIAFFATSPQTSFLTGKNMMTTVLTKEWKNINKNGFLFQKRTGYPNMVASQLRHCLCLAKHSARWRCSVFCYHNNACYPCNKPASLANYTNYWEQQHCIGSSVGLVSTSF